MGDGFVPISSEAGPLQLQLGLLKRRICQVTGGRRPQLHRVTGGAPSLWDPGPVRGLRSAAALPSAAVVRLDTERVSVRLHGPALTPVRLYTPSKIPGDVSVP